MNKSPGFSLIEVLVALLLLQMALLALAPMFIYAAKSTASSGDMGKAGALATQRMELLVAAAFDTQTAGGNLTSNAAGFFDDTNSGFIVRWRITDDASPVRRKYIDVRAVSLRAVVGRAKEVSLSHIKAE